MPIAVFSRKLKELHCQAPGPVSTPFACLVSARAALIQPALRPLVLLKTRRHIAGKRISPDGLQFAFTFGILERGTLLI
jgi:hypothetical protein